MSLEDETLINKQIQIFHESEAFGGLKTVKYQAGWTPNDVAEIAYAVDDNRVIFTATGRKTGNPNTTINTAEEVIVAICNQEGLDWREYEYYDLQTAAGGYIRHAKFGTTALDRLTLDISGQRPEVIGWETLFDTDLGVGVPNFEEIIKERFQSFRDKQE